MNAETPPWIVTMPNRRKRGRILSPGMRGAGRTSPCAFFPVRPEWARGVRSPIEEQTAASRGVYSRPPAAPRAGCEWSSTSPSKRDRGRQEKVPRLPRQWEALVASRATNAPSRPAGGRYSWSLRRLYRRIGCSAAKNCHGPVFNPVFALGHDTILVRRAAAIPRPWRAWHRGFHPRPRRRWPGR
jgi:hypothetical protein